MSYYQAASGSLLTATDEQRLARAIEEGVAARERLEAARGIEDAAERNELRRAVKAGESARKRFIEANLRLVLSIATKTRAPGHIDRDDLIQDGMLGLERAVEKFDWRKGYKFSTYATWWIRQGIQRGLENTATTIRIPAHRASELHVALSAVDGDHAKIPTKLAAIAATSSPVSLDRHIGESGTALGDTIASDDVDPAAEVVAEAESIAIHGLVDRLDPTTRHAVVRRFGLDGQEAATYGEIAAQLGVGAEAVRRRVKRALRDLRGPARHFAA